MNDSPKRISYNRRVEVKAMFETIKEHISKITKIADSCPEKYQVKCFEVLLNALVAQPTPVPARAGIGQALGTERVQPDFFAQHDIAPDVWAQVFHYDGSSYFIIVRDLGAQPTSKKQVKLALLLGIKNLLETGEPRFGKNNLKELCERYGAFDSPNFAANMKKQKHLFLLKDGDAWVLTRPGEQEAAKVTKELGS